MKTWRYFDLATGVFTENTFSSDHDVPPELPGRGVREDVTHWRSVRVEDDELVPYQPPQPSPNHEWDEALGMWRLTPAAAERLKRKIDAQVRIADLEGRQPRALRELALGMDGARDRLQAIDAEIAALRVQLQGAP